jgi:uncharacterized protein
MIGLIAENLERIRDLCRTHQVASLDLFGSAATGTFDPSASDLNFVVNMGDSPPGTGFRYLDLIAGLEDLLGYEVHMVTDSALTDPLLREIIGAQRVRLYEAGND